ncbi:MAG: 30S ribosome-binding factor RbfA [Pseudomonadota bacterium]
MASKTHSSAKAPSQRQLRVAEIIRRAIVEALQRGEINDPRLEAYTITVPEVRITPDLKIATAYVMPLGGKGAKEVVKLLAFNAKPIRSFVSKRIDLKYAPSLRFQVDETFDEASRIDALLRSDRVRADIEAADDEDGAS